MLIRTIARMFIVASLLILPVCLISPPSQTESPRRAEQLPDSQSVVRPSDQDSGYFKDDFSVVSQLKSTEWQTSTPLLNAVAQLYHSEFVPSQISFSQEGLTLQGVDSKHQFTGVQSSRNFNPPFTVEAKVMGTVPNGMPFDLFLLNADLSEHLGVIGDLNNQDGIYYGAWVGSTKEPISLLYKQVTTATWYVIRESVQADGTGSVELLDPNGSVLAARYYLRVGKGPFFVVMGQGASNSVSAGPNIALWASLSLTPPVAPTDIAYADFSGPTIHTENISIVPTLNFAYNDTFGGSWRILASGGGFTGVVALPQAGLYDLAVTHLSSMSPGCPDRGYSAVTIQVNSGVIVGNYDPGSNHGAAHDMVTDTWTFLGHAGPNTLQWTGAVLCTHYWIQRIRFNLIQSFPSRTVPAKPATTSSSYD